MSNRQRLRKYAERLTEVGLAGGDMQSKLAQIVAAEDLTPHEIGRICEMANRDVQLGLYKSAEDKRFKFALADPKSASAQARKQAEASAFRPLDAEAKYAAAVDEAGGDPFAPPGDAAVDSLDPGPVKLSLFEQPLDEGAAYAAEEHRTRELMLALDKQRQDYEAVVKEARAACVEVYDNATDVHKRAVQDALDLVMHGVTLPSLTMALYAAVSGSRSGPEAVKATEDLLVLIVQGLRERGVPNHRLGFRWPGCVDEIDALSTEDVVALAKRSCGLQAGGDISLQTQKRAQRYLETQPNMAAMRPTGRHPFEDAEDHLQNRPSVAEYGQPQAYLDDKNVDNLPGGAPKVVNGDSEFVIGIRDLMGAQDRLTRLHAAQEYLGLKIKQIEDSMRTLKTAQRVSAEQFEERKRLVEESKEAIAPLVATLGKSLLTGAAMQTGMSAAQGAKPKASPATKSSPPKAKLGGASELETALASGRIGELTKAGAGLAGKGLGFLKDTAKQTGQFYVVNKALSALDKPKKPKPGEADMADQPAGGMV